MYSIRIVPYSTLHLSRSEGEGEGADTLESNRSKCYREHWYRNIFDVPAQLTEMKDCYGSAVKIKTGATIELNIRLLK